MMAFCKKVILFQTKPSQSINFPFEHPRTSSRAPPMSHHTRRSLHAQRKGWFTNDATITDSRTNHEYADIHYAGLIENGAITYPDNQKHRITHRVASGVWKLHPVDRARDRPLMVAKKPKAWSRRMEIKVPHHGKFVLEPSKSHKTNFHVYNAHGNVSRVGDLIADDDKRKGYALIFDTELPEHLPIFCYWLANMLNRRDKFEPLYDEAFDFAPI